MMLRFAILVTFVGLIGYIRNITSARHESVRISLVAMTAPCHSIDVSPRRNRRRPGFNSRIRRDSYFFRRFLFPRPHRPHSYWYLSTLFASHCVAWAHSAASWSRYFSSTTSGIVELLDLYPLIRQGCEDPAHKKNCAKKGKLTASTNKKFEKFSESGN